MDPYILIVNDHEWSARSLESVLQPGGFEIHRTFSAALAKESIDRRSPDALLVDLQLPDQAGPSLCSELRGTGAIDRVTPILVTTAGPSGRAERLAALAAGAWDFVPLPADGEALLLKLKNMIDARGARFAGSGWGVNQPPMLGCLIVRDAPGRDHGPLVRGLARRSDLVGELRPGWLALVGPLCRRGATLVAARLARRLGELGSTGGPPRIWYRGGFDAVGRPGAGAVLSFVKQATEVVGDGFSDRSPTGFEELMLSQPA